MRMGLTNLALNKMTSASSYVMPYAPSRAVDGSFTVPTSRWLCNTIPAWLSVNLGSICSINRWVVRHMPVAGWKASDYCMRDFKLQVSNDNTNWKDVDVVSNNTNSVTDRTMPTPVSCRYVRVYVTKGLQTNPKFASFMELEVYQAPPSQYLSNLQLSTGALNPAFAGRTTFAYTTNVVNGVKSIAVAPIAEDSDAKITVNGIDVKSGTASTPINLNVGVNTIKVVVTKADKSASQAYTLTVTRASSAYLTKVNVTYKNGKSSTTVSVPIVKNQVEYSANIIDKATSVTIAAYSEDPNAKILVNGNQNLTNGQVSAAINVTVGVTKLPIIVTSAIGTDNKSYSIAII